MRQALFISSVWGALFLSVFFFVCCAAPFHVTRKDCPTQTLGLLFPVSGVCDTASLLNYISVQQVPTRWIHAFTPLKTKYRKTAKTNGENNICVTNKNKTLTHLCHVLPLGNYSHGTLTQHLPEEAGRSCVFPPFLQKRDLTSRKQLASGYAACEQQSQKSIHGSLDSKSELLLGHRSSARRNPD